MAKSRFGYLLYRWHAWAGLVSGVFLLVICVSGSIAVFRPEIERAVEQRGLKPRFLTEGLELPVIIAVVGTISDVGRIAHDAPDHHDRGEHRPNHNQGPRIIPRHHVGVLPPALLTGELSPTIALARGDVRTKGNVAKVLRLVPATVKAHEVEAKEKELEQEAAEAAK